MAMAKRNTSNLITLILAIAGCVLAAILTYQHFNPIDLPCGVSNGGCEEVLTSPLSNLGPVPTAALGLLTYLALVVLCVLRRKQLRISPQSPTANAGQATLISHEASPGAVEAPGAADDGFASLFASDARVEALDPGVRILNLLIWLLSTAAFLFSWYLQFNVLFQIHSFCPYCFTSAIFVTIIFGIASFDYRLREHPLSEEMRILVGFVLGIAVLGGITIALQYQPPKPVHPPTFKPGGDLVSESMRPYLMRPDIHLKGDTPAPITVVEFADYQCPSCKHAVLRVDDLARQWNGKVRFSFRNYPLKSHAWSFLGAEAAEAGGGQGQFWKMHDYIYDHQSDLESVSFNIARFTDYARAIGLDVDRFKDDMASHKYRSRVQHDLMDGDKAGVTQTPSFFIVTSKEIWKFTSVDDVASVLNDTTHPMWH